MISCTSLSYFTWNIEEIILIWYEIFLGATETATQKEPCNPICCRGMTVDCMACAKCQTIEEYCEDEENKDKEGCEGRNLHFLSGMSKVNCLRI